MINYILSLIAIFIFIILEPISFIYVNFFKKKFNWRRLSGYFKTFAIDVDRFGNSQYRSLFNRFLITENGYKFGDFRETISSALGKNVLKQTLTKSGKILVSILDFLDENHCIKSVNNFEDESIKI